MASVQESRPYSSREQPSGGQITSSPNVENYPGIASVSGSEFSMNLMDQAVKLGTQTMMEQVTGIREEADYKVIVTTEKNMNVKALFLPRV